MKLGPMKLPHSGEAVVERGKVLEYLLNPMHRYGASKAQFFVSYGYGAEKWEILAKDLREHGQRHDVRRVVETGFGPPGGRADALTGRTGSNDSHSLATGSRTACTEAHNRLSFRVMIKEHECVVLTKDLTAEGLKAGDIGTVVHIHSGGAGYEVEFMTLAGETVTVVTLLPQQLRSIARREIAHVRALQAA